MIRFIQGDCRDVLATLPAESVHCCVTSPPYWGLRDYGIPPTIWGGDSNCNHDFDIEIVEGELRLGGGMVELGKRYRGGGHKVSEIPRIKSERGFCRHCGAWNGVHGLEPTIDLYVKNAVEVFRAVHRVLRSDGTLWLNLGDSYAQAKGHGHWESRNGKGDEHGQKVAKKWADMDASDVGLKPKDLCGIPWRVAFALQADGWCLRQDIIWAKSNAMPESVTDRCTKAHEYIFLLTKSARYFFDAEAIKERAIAADLGAFDGGPQRLPDGSNANDGRNFRIGAKGNAKTFRGGSYVGGEPGPRTEVGNVANETLSRNKRSVWTVATSPFSEAHFATFPPQLIKPCIKAGTSEKGCCSKCGAPWGRRIDVESRANAPSCNGKYDGIGKHRTVGGGVSNDVRARVQLGWQPTCQCNASVIPCTVLDPFGGAGTTALVSNDLRRDVISIELNPDFIKMGRKRLPRLFAEVIVE